MLWRKKTERQNGLGKNVVISEYDEKICENFLNNYENYRNENRKKSLNPSFHVVDVLEEIKQTIQP